ncbi:TPA: hypothetical protein ACRRX3_001644 [Morganella morganii]|uniref:hypothetical protein n=1 Tax=Morganella morganii TaxID=582 RepID=UPI001BD9E0E6|nr:hypothetical protein [Morganella morganii]ELF0883233.1 hypothetical protein [Morganella morganii]MBT0388303.1 hypothetical protein [Morganella morganii subsp. morganii]MBT0395090.1 hypothetical protein [Morganella morganii subsp. morganii]MDR5685475.1 hypothetical protein [Morganella morganii]HCR3196283.1 hypothetical protein [Morganella morganii]
MKLQEIKNKVSSLPTIMDISDELLLINELMTVPYADLAKDMDTLKFIINALDLSHTDSGFMELTKENESVFMSFYCWLNRANSEVDLGLNANVIDSFSLTVDDIKKLMS